MKLTKDQQAILDTIQQFKPVNVARVLAVATTLRDMEQEGGANA